MWIDACCEKVSAFFSSPRNVLILGCLIGVFCTLLLLIVSPVYYRDSVVYVSMTNAFRYGDWFHAFNLSMSPLLSTLAGIFAWIGLPALEATMLLSSIFYILTIFPLFGLFSFFMERKYAAWGALLFLLMPRVLRYGAAPLLDSGRWLFFSLSLYLIFSFVREKNFRTLLWLGCSFAALCLVRSEGIVYVGILFVTWALLLLHRVSWVISRKVVGHFLCSCFLVAGFCFLICLPRLMHLYAETGYFSLDTRQTWAIRGIVYQVEKIFGDSPPVMNSNETSVTSYGNINDFNYAWIFDSKFERRFWKNLINGCFPLYLVFSILGIIIIARRKEWTINHSIMLFLLVVNAVAFFLMRSSAGRYFYINAVFLMPFTIGGLLFVWEWVEKVPRKFHVNALMMLLLLVAAILQLINGLDNIFSSKNDYFQYYGEKLAKWQNGKQPRSGTRRITLLTIGDEYGWGIYAGANSFAYASRNINKNWTMEDIVKNGLPSNLANFVNENLAGYKTLLPDVIVVGDIKSVSPELIERIRHIPGVKEFSFPDSSFSKKALFFSLNQGDKK